MMEHKNTHINDFGKMKNKNQWENGKLWLLYGKIKAC